jgi:hypothetical protein
VRVPSSLASIRTPASTGTGGRLGRPRATHVTASARTSRSTRNFTGRPALRRTPRCPPHTEVRTDPNATETGGQHLPGTSPLPSAERHGVVRAAHFPQVLGAGSISLGSHRCRRACGCCGQAPLSQVVGLRALCRTGGSRLCITGPFCGRGYGVHNTSPANCPLTPQVYGRYTPVFPLMSTMCSSLGKAAVHRVIPSLWTPKWAVGRLCYGKVTATPHQWTTFVDRAPPADVGGLGIGAQRVWPGSFSVISGTGCGSGWSAP